VNVIEYHIAPGVLLLESCANIFAYAPGEEVRRRLAVLEKVEIQSERTLGATMT